MILVKEAKENKDVTVEKKSSSTEANDKLELMLKENLSCEMFHFILNVFYAPRVAVKVILFVFILIACGLASYTTITLILTYLQYNVITMTRTINETPTVFPKVTICNKNLFATQYAYEFLLESNLIDVMQMNRILNGDRNEAILYWTLFRAILSGKILNVSDEQKKRFGHSLNDTLLSCLFDYEVCHANDFQWEWDTYYGNCYSFNSGFNYSGQSITLKESSLSGSTFGLHMEFYVNYYENLSQFNSIIDNYGLVVRINNVSHAIDYSHDGIFVSPGFHTFLALERQFSTTLPKPYSSCDDLDASSFDSDLFNLISKSKYQYTQKFCLIQCMQELFTKMCNCGSSDFALLRNASFCGSLVEIECDFQAYTRIYLKNNYVQNECIPRCPLECNSSRITYTPSSSQLVSSTYTHLLENNVNLRSDFINRSIQDEIVVLQSVVKLSIFYDSLSYTISTETPQMDIISLIANIGGNLGLFMGVCLFSLGEMVVTLIELLFLKLFTNMKVKTTT